MKEWLDETSASLKQALEIVESGEVPQQNMFMLAPIIYSQKHHMNNDALFQEMCDANEAQVEYEWSVDEKSKAQYKFHYVSSYLNCFVMAGKMDEMKYDRIMEFVCSEVALFTDDYDID